MKILISIVILFTMSFLFVVVADNCLSASSLIFGDSFSVETVLERYIQACGGSALNDIITETGTGTLVRNKTGQVPFTTVSKAPGKFYYNQVFAWGDQISYGYDGNIAWVQTTNSVENMGPEQLRDMRLLFDAHAPLKLKKFFPEMILKGKEKIEHGEIVIISAKSVNGSQLDLVFDQGTGLLIRAGEIFFEDYRDIGSVKNRIEFLGRVSTYLLKLSAEASKLKSFRNRN